MCGQKVPSTKTCPFATGHKQWSSGLSLYRLPFHWAWLQRYCLCTCCHRQLHKVCAGIPNKRSKSPDRRKSPLWKLLCALWTAKYQISCRLPCLASASQEPLPTTLRETHNWKASIAHSCLVCQLVHAYNSTRNDATRYSPYFLMFGREVWSVDLCFGKSEKSDTAGKWPCPDSQSWHHWKTQATGLMEPVPLCVDSKFTQPSCVSGKAREKNRHSENRTQRSLTVHWLLGHAVCSIREENTTKETNDQGTENKA